MPLSYFEPPASQLASSQVSHYFPDLFVNVESGYRGPVPLRSNNSFVSLLQALGKSYSGPLLAQSILRSKSYNKSTERLDSLVETSKHPRASVLKRFLDYSNVNIAKKRVQFADAVWEDLIKIRVFCDDWDGNWEPDSQPRSHRYRILGKNSCDVTEEDLVVEVAEWQANFSQPTADYVGYREKLETNSAGLENVIMKRKNNSFMGTVRVSFCLYRIFNCNIFRLA